MPRAVWTGAITFGLVSIPVRMYPATSPRDVRFHQYDRETGRRVRYRRVVEEPDDPPAIDRGPAIREMPPPSEDVGAEPRAAHTPGTGELADLEAPPRPERGDADVEAEDRPREVPWQGIVKGYEIAPGRVVMVDREEVERLRPEPSDAIEIEHFVDLAEVDPVYFEKAYHLVPWEHGRHPYAVLLRAMEASDRVAVGRFVLRTKEHLAAIRPAGGHLALSTLFFADEIRHVEDPWANVTDEEVGERELRLAASLIDALTEEWAPERYRDEQRQRILDLIASKGPGIEVPEDAEDTAIGRPVPDLMAALKASVEAVREGKRRSGSAG